MEITFAYKWMARSGLFFLILSLIELIFIILFNSVIEMNLNGGLYLIGFIIYSSGFMPFHAILMQIIIIGTVIIFLTFGSILLWVSKKKILKELSLAKFFLLIGLFLIIGNLFKITFIVFLGKTEINTGGINITFQNAVLNFSITSLLGVIIWYYFFGVICFFLISGLIYGAVGLKWILNLQEHSTTDT